MSSAVNNVLLNIKMVLIDINLKYTICYKIPKLYIGNFSK